MHSVDAAPAGMPLGDELADALVRIAAPRDRLIVHAGEIIDLAPGDSIVIGRAGSRAAPGDDATRFIGIDHPMVSRRHLRLHDDGEGLIAEDLGSRNGTTIVRNGEPEHLTAPVQLIAGDLLVTVGDVLLAEIGLTR